MPLAYEYNLTKITDSNNHSTDYAYYAQGAFDSLVNVNGLIASYDAVETVTYPDGAVGKRGRVLTSDKISNTP